MPPASKSDGPPTKSWWARDIAPLAPEIAHLPAAERKRLLDAARRRLHRRPLFAAIVAGVCLPLLLPLLVLAASLFEPSLQWVMGSWFFTAVILIAGIDGWLLLYLVRYLWRRELRQLLLEENIRPSRCFECLQDATAVDAPRCSHCGAMLVAP